MLVHAREDEAKTLASSLGALDSKAKTLLPEAQLGDVVSCLRVERALVCGLGLAALANGCLGFGDRGLKFGAAGLVFGLLQVE